jgi:hypothetical protein
VEEAVEFIQITKRVCSERERPDLSAVNSTPLVSMLSIRAALPFTSYTSIIISSSIIGSTTLGVPWPPRDVS